MGFSQNLHIFMHWGSLGVYPAPDIFEQRMSSFLKKFGGPGMISRFDRTVSTLSFTGFSVCKIIFTTVEMSKFLFFHFRLKHGQMPAAASFSLDIAQYCEGDFY